MKIKSIPDDPKITLSSLNELVKMYEDIKSKINDMNKTVTEFTYDYGRMSAFELVFKLLGVEFETGDQA